jgi:hypothetical protein
MPKQLTVEAPGELLAYLFQEWPELKKKQIRTWLKFQAITVNDRPVSQFDHPWRQAMLSQFAPTASPSQDRPVVGDEGVVRRRDPHCYR